MNLFLRPRAIALAAALLAPLAATAQLQDKPLFESIPTSLLFGFERIRLPQGERLGLAGASLLFDIGSGWAAGPGVYGAATGTRGGLFVGGLELQRRWQLAPGWSLASGLYLGGGGGAAAPVGGGLMMRPALTLLRDLGPSLQLGASVSSVRFPSGEIASSQLGIALAWRGEFVHLTGEHGSASSPLSVATGLGFDQMAATLSTYRIEGDNPRAIGLAGARAELRSADEHIAWGMEAAAAARGDAAGYMELLGTAALSTAPFENRLPSWRIGLRVAAGLGGGGALPTGGGLMGKASATLAWRFAADWMLGAEYGWVESAEGGLRARQVQVWVGTDLEPAHAQRSTGSVVRAEWVGVVQHHANVSRRDGSRQSLDTIGLKLNRYIGEHFYLSGQAHSAFAGGAGAYSVGLAGAGFVTSLRDPLRIGIEALVGAAGGGGVETSGGAIGQAVLWAGWNSSRNSEWRAGIGTVRGLRDHHGNPLAELAWSRAFGMVGR